MADARPPALSVHFLASLDELEENEWEAVTGTDYPFLRHRFLLGLEATGCTTAESGWQPCHLVMKSGAAIAAVMPLYLKFHSWGEYVFDWAWAEAWEQLGLHYYPKLVTAIPFTPATGPRLLTAAGLDRATAWAAALAAIRQLAETRELSSWHVLFPPEDDSETLLQLGLHRRTATQFHWFNPGYACFDEFLAELSSRKRKSIRRERRRVVEQGITLRTLTGEAISLREWEQFHHFYQLTYAKRSGHGGYLSREFFTETAAGMGGQVVMVMAERGDRAVAAALYFRSADTLYGRYWGCTGEFDCLHFEACYYRGIEYCIENGLRRFDPGAQGEHKIQRGFRPVPTWSNHWVADPRLSAAVADFSRREQAQSEDYQRRASTLLPFKAP